VSDWKSINTVIIPFFLQYPLRGTKHLDPNYISGFVTGDGCFSLIVKKDYPDFGRICFAIDQHTNNRALLLSLLSALDLTSNTLRPNGSDWLRISTTSRATIKNVILPFCLKYPLLGVKSSIVLKLSIPYG